MSDARAANQTYLVGHGGKRIRIQDGWRVLDVGSGHNPHPRADVLLERDVDDNENRGGGGMDTSDPRLVIGDALNMPFRDGEFDYVIASHIAEHVDDPEQLCRELSRVARAGYVETPGWFGDRLLREDYHHWRVGRHGRSGLRFEEVDGRRPFGIFGEALYFIVYFGEQRPGHRIPAVRNRLVRSVLEFTKRLAGRIMRLPKVRPVFFTCLEWSGTVECVVRRLAAQESSASR